MPALNFGSYKDPSGFVFSKEGVLYRQVNKSYREHFDYLIKSGLYKKLVENGSLITHSTASLKLAQTKDAYCIIKPSKVPFVSYPYEWSFSQLKEAALLTLEIQKKSLDYGMILKDASSYNIQFIGPKPIFIDTLSFEIYKEGIPWIGYKQFCEHFLGPLALASYVDLRFLNLLDNFLDGFPLDFVSRLLPKKTYLNFGIAVHIHWHALMQKALAGRQINKSKSKKLSKRDLLNLIDNLSNTISGLKFPSCKTEWGEYYSDTNYSECAFENKKKIVYEMTKKIAKEESLCTVFDLGANTGNFSQIVAKHKNTYVISSDYDALAVEKNFNSARSNNIKNLLSLNIDITNPSSDIGWALRERQSIVKRGPYTLVMALALIHHLAIKFNIPLSAIISHFAELGRWAIIEFIPKEDSQVKRLLQNRDDIFSKYSQEDFEFSAKEYFDILEKVKIKDSDRILYMLKRRKESRS